MLTSYKLIARVLPTTLHKTTTLWSIFLLCGDYGNLNSKMAAMAMLPSIP